MIGRVFAPVIWGAYRIFRRAYDGNFTVSKFPLEHLNFQFFHHSFTSVVSTLLLQAGEVFAAVLSLLSKVKSFRNC